MKRSILMIAYPVVLALAIVLVSPASSAEDMAKKNAEALLDEGNKRFDQKDYAGALSRFQKAHKLYADPSILVNLGLTLVKLKRLPEAAVRYEQFLKRADIETNARLIKGIRSRLDALRIKLGSVTVACKVAGAEVTVDGKRAGSTPLKHRLYVEPGRHQVAVIGAGYRPYREELVLLPGEHQVMTAALVSSAPSKKEPGTRAVDLVPAQPPRTVSRPFYKKWWFWTAVGVAVAGGVVAIVVPNATRDTRVPGDPVHSSKQFTLGSRF